MLSAPIFSFFLAAALGASGCGQRADASPERSSSAPTTSAAPKKDATAALQEIIARDRPATADALSEMMREIVVQAHEGAALEESLKALMLDDPKGWFGSVFPKPMQDRLAAEYAAIPPSTLANAIKLAVLQRAGAGSSAEVYKIEQPNTGDGTGYQSAAIAAMTNKVPLYLVAFRENDPAASTKLGGLVRVWSFVHDGKRFRYVGKLKAVAATPVKEGDATDKSLELTMFEARDGVPGAP